LVEELQFDVEHNRLWLPGWGAKPSTVSAQKECVGALVTAAPRMIPVIGHRYLLAEPCQSGNPVFLKSINQTSSTMGQICGRIFSVNSCGCWALTRTTGAKSASQTRSESARKPMKQSRSGGKSTEIMLVSLGAGPARGLRPEVELDHRGPAWSANLNCVGPRLLTRIPQVGSLGPRTDVAVSPTVAQSRVLIGAFG
jgi:hypothetical protein